MVDDGSTDESVEWVQQLASDDPRVRVVRRQRAPSGAPTCRNIGAQLARGGYIVFLDSDDLLAPHCLAQRVSYLDTHPDLDFAVFPMVLFEREPWDLALLWNTWHQSPCLDRCDLRRFLSEDPPWHTSMPIWRRVTLDRLGAWDETVGSWQDWELHVRALATDGRYAHVPAPPDCHHRKHRGRRISSEAFGAEVLERRVETFRSTIERLGRSKLAESDWVPEFLRLLAGQAEKSALSAAPADLVMALLHLARDLRPTLRWRWHVLEAYLLVQRALAIRRIPLARGGLLRAGHLLRPQWFSGSRTYGRHGLDRKAIAAVPPGHAGSPQPPEFDWADELLSPGLH